MCRRERRTRTPGTLSSGSSFLEVRRKLKVCNGVEVEVLEEEVESLAKGQGGEKGALD